MNQIAKICFTILAALAIFLAGWIAGNWNTRNAVSGAVKKAISETTKVQKKALEKTKAEYEDKLRKKDELVVKLKEIIERLLAQLQAKDSTGFSAASTKGGMKLADVLNDQLNKLKSV
ncbi:MAG: hypothetical protein K2H92_04300 [Bacteroidaceae bacterium]|nr:hypothetical protein [Bacteroidaceae bacterium]